MRHSYRRWRNEEITFLRENYGLLSLEEIAKKLGRLYSSVKSKSGRIDKIHPRKIRIFRLDNLCDIDVAYIAGLIDGEGSITIARDRRQFYAPRITITNTNPYLLKWLKLKLGSEGSFFEKKSRGRAWEWRIQGYGVLPAIQRLNPFLVIKKAQAQIAINFIRERKKMSDWEFHCTPKMEKLYKTIKILNRRFHQKITIKEREKVYEDALKELGDKFATTSLRFVWKRDGMRSQRSCCLPPL